jgi:hypothetical protein
LELISIPSIATIVYWVINLLKYTFNNSEKFKRFIPLIATLLGIVFGVVCFFSLPEIIPADNVFLAIVIGGASGLSATGSHQLLKQLENKKR